MLSLSSTEMLDMQDFKKGSSTYLLKTDPYVVYGRELFQNPNRTHNLMFYFNFNDYYTYYDPFRLYSNAFCKDILKQDVQEKIYNNSYQTLSYMC